MACHRTLCLGLGFAFCSTLAAAQPLPKGSPVRDDHALAREMAKARTDELKRLRREDARAEKKAAPSHRIDPEAAASKEGLGPSTPAADPERISDPCLRKPRPSYCAP